MRSRAVALIVLLLALVIAGPSLADKRVALIVGNSAYRNVPGLVNPTRDAAAIADLLRTAGFELVEARQDLTNAEMRRTLRDFANKSRDADMAVVYYAGHGIEVDGMNYLIPIDAALEQDVDAADEAVQLDRVLQVIEPARRLRLIILDACRDNPFNRTMKRAVATRALGRGLIGIEPSKPNTLIAFAAKAGSTADDGAGQNSPFTVALLRHLTTPGLDLRQVFGRVRDDVMKATDDRQEPFVYGSLGGATVSLVPGPKTVDPAPPAHDPEAVIRKNFEFALQLNSRRAWEYFLQQHAAGYYANLARIHLDKIATEEAKVESSARVAPEDGRNKSAVVSTPGPEQAPQISSGGELPVAALDRSKTSEMQAGVSGPINDPKQLREIRSRLFELNFDPGPFDGPFGENARRAVREYESLNGMAITGQPTTELLGRLQRAKSLGPWATIVFAKGTDKWGMSWGKPSRQEAIASARSSCGKSDCSTEVSVFGQECAAFAHSSKSWAMAARESVPAAERAALSECEKKGRSCRVIASTCAGGTDRASAR